MKNREKFREDILSWAKNSDPYCDPYCEFAKKNIIPSFTNCTNGGCGGITCTWCRAIFAFWLGEEYVEPPKPEVDWSKVPVDTLVRVRNSENEEWTLQYFKCISDTIPDHRFEAWDDGRTSKTTDGLIKHWKHCELVEDEDDGK